MGTPIVNLRQLVDDRVTENVAVQETHVAKQEVIDALDDAQVLVDGLNTEVSNKKVELDNYADLKEQEIETLVTTEKTEAISEFNDNTTNKTAQYNSNHNAKLSEYNENDTLKLDQYNTNHIERLDDLNYAYADRIVDLLKTKNFLGAVDEFAAVKPTQYATFLDTALVEYRYYLNGVLMEESVDYIVLDDTTIGLTNEISAHDVVLQINYALLIDLLAASGQVTADMIGVPDGVAGLDSNGQVPSSQLPSYVDDVVEVATYADLPAIGENDKIYVVVADETQGGNTTSYRWATSTYAIVSNNLTAADVKTLYESNLDTNVFTDADKLEVDTIQSRLDVKQDTLVDGVNIKTINGDGITGSGNLLVSAGASGFAANVYFTDQVSTTVETYKQLSYTPDEITSELIAQVDDTAPVLVEDYVFDGDVVADFIPAGEWQFSFSRKVDNNAGLTRLRFDVFKRSSGGVETIMFSKYSDEIDDTTYANENILFIQPSYVVDPTDRICVKIYAETDRNNLVTVSMEIGDGNAAYFVTPLGLRHNQLRAREEENAHPIEAITGLTSSLSTLQQNIDNITTIEEW